MKETDKKTKPNKKYHEIFKVNVLKWKQKNKECVCSWVHVDSLHAERILSAVICTWLPSDQINK